MIIKSYFARKEEDQSGGALTPSQSLIKDLIDALSESQKTDNTSRRFYFHADLFLWKNYIYSFELLACANNMVKASERNAVMLVREGLVPQLTRVLTIWNESDTTLFDRKRFTNEKLNALQMCHLLALIAPTAKELRANEELILCTLIIRVNTFCSSCVCLLYTLLSYFVVYLIRIYAVYCSKWDVSLCVSAPAIFSIGRRPRIQQEWI